MTGGSYHDDATTEFLRRHYAFDEHQQRYKEGLAEALVAFNRIENFVSDMIYTILNQAGRDDLVAKAVGAQFMGRVANLELLLVSIPHAPKVPTDRLATLAGKRNIFAHGHFTADQNTSELVILGKGKPTPWDPESVILFWKNALHCVSS